MKNSFTLIEIMISVMIIFLIVSVMLDISANIKTLFEVTSQRSLFELKSSISAIENSDIKNLYEKLQEFNISNDEVIKNLKSENLKIDKKIEFSQQYQTNEKYINIVMKKVKIYDNYHSIYFYEVELK